MLMALLAFLLHTNPAPVRVSHLTVLGGSGSGAYSCGEKVPIVAEKARGGQVFAHWALPWDGDTPVDRVHRRKAVVTMPCHDATVEARFIPAPPKRIR